MKKVLAITCLLVLALSSVAMAGEAHWRLNLRAEDPNLMNAHVAMTFGARDTALDDVDSNDAVFNWPIVVASTAFAAGVMPISGGTWTRHLQNNADPQTLPGGKRIWEIRVAAGAGYAHEAIQLSVWTVSGTLLPPAELGGEPMIYKLVMANNRGKAGAPVAGTSWEIPIPTAHETRTAIAQIPTLKLSALNEEAMLSEGYVMHIVQEVVPEPSALFALGSGLVGLAGLAVRRRRA